MNVITIIILIICGIVLFCIPMALIISWQDKKQQEEDEKWLEYIKSRGKITEARFKRATAAYYDYKPESPYIKELQFEERRYYLQSKIVRKTINAMEDVIFDEFPITCIKVLKDSTVVIIGTNEKGEEYSITIEKGTTAVSHAEITFEDNSKAVLY